MQLLHIVATNTRSAAHLVDGARDVAFYLEVLCSGLSRLVHAVYHSPVIRLRSRRLSIRTITPGPKQNASDEQGRRRRLEEMVVYQTLFPSGSYRTAPLPDCPLLPLYNRCLV